MPRTCPVIGLHHMRRTIAALAVCAIGAAACTGSATDDDAAEGPTELFTESASEPDGDADAASSNNGASASDGPSSQSASPAEPTEDSDEIDITTTPPFDEVDQAWVDAVVNELFANFHDELVSILEMPVEPFTEGVPVQLPDGMEERLDDSFRGQYLDRSGTDLRAALVDLDEDRSGLLPPGESKPSLWRTRTVRFSEPGCVIAVGLIESRVAADPQDDDIPVAISLTDKPDEVTDEINPTGWVAIDILPNINAEGERLPDEFMFEAGLTEYDGNLNNSCTGAARDD